MVSDIPDVNRKMTNLFYSVVTPPNSNGQTIPLNCLFPRVSATNKIKQVFTVFDKNNDG